MLSHSTSSSINTISILNNKQSKHLIMGFCKFCKDAGKTQKEFTSHFPKDKPGKDGKVVCPTILNNECRYCHEKGHAKSHCPVLKAKNSRKRMTGGSNRWRRRPRQTEGNLNGWVMNSCKQQKPRPITTVKRSSSSNPFAALSEQDDTARKVVALPKVMKPKAAAGSWAKKPDLNKEAIQQRLANMKQELAVEEQLNEDEVQMTQLLSVKELKKCHEDVYDARVSLNRAAYEVFNQCSVPAYVGSWADACDSDSDGEIDEEEIASDSFGRPKTDNSAW
jgi:hypothetical protein